MTKRTTPARYSLRLQNIQKMFDEVISYGNGIIMKLPELYNYDYDFYRESVLKENPLHDGKIYYKGFEVRRIGK